MRAGLYARVSTTEQAEEGYSIEAQLEAMRRYCHNQGWEVAAEYTDPGISGTTGDRPGLLAALADCEARRIDALLTHRLDRFYRNLRLQLETMERLEGWGVTYVSVSENLDFGAPYGKLVASMMGSVSQYFIDNLRRETRKGKVGRAKAGYSNTNIAPHGYERVDGREVIREEEAAAMRCLFEQYATGQYSYQRLAELMNRDGYPASTRAKSGRWTWSAVAWMLKNRFYIGEVKHTSESGEVVWYPGQHQAIISLELWEQAQRVKDARTLRIPRNPRHVHLLQGVAYCVHCGCPIWTDTKRGGLAYYWCPARRKGRDCPVVSRYVNTETIDAQIVPLIERLQLPGDWRERLEELSKHREEHQDIEGKRQYIKGKLRRLRDLYLEGDFDKAEYTRRKADLQTQLDALKVPARPEVEQAGETLESLGREFAGASKRIQRDILRVIFAAVYVDVEGRRLVCVKPYPQFAPLFRMDGIREEGGCFYVGEEETQEAGPES